MACGVLLTALALSNAGVASQASGSYSAAQASAAASQASSSYSAAQAPAAASQASSSYSAAQAPAAAAAGQTGTAQAAASSGASGFSSVYTAPRSSTTTTLAPTTTTTTTEKTPEGFAFVTNNCNCGKRLEHHASSQLHHCGDYCRENSACKSFGLWNGVGSPQLCVLFDATCPAEEEKCPKQTHTAGGFRNVVYNKLSETSASRSYYAGFASTTPPKLATEADARVDHKEI
eukprot:TRINITY_DN8039_c0_g1_i3.p1 TRINITY_DN8039_c0_g1~~TRINITY_DN8039_c0_g1_i3.p1  ORF type:complete len:247 (-),score=48.25 TRINITY_DN8039_c0_g1_i3:20-715(-)